MSERGSWCSEYIYCGDCAEALGRLLRERDSGKYFSVHQIPSWQPGEQLPIFAGKIGGLYGGEELHLFEEGMVPEIAKVICHPVRFAVLAEDGERIFKIEPSRPQNTSCTK